MTSSHISSIKLITFSKEQRVCQWADSTNTHWPRWVSLQVDDHVSMMHIHVFAAYFGLTVAWCLSRPGLEGAHKKDRMRRSPSLFAMLGKDKVGGWFPTWGEQVAPKCSAENHSPLLACPGCPEPHHNDAFP